MLPISRFVIFDGPTTLSDLATKSARIRRFQLQTGSYGKRLVDEIITHNCCPAPPSGDYSIFWGTASEAQMLSPVCSLQKINHFPNSRLILGNKAVLASVLQSSPSFRLFPHFFPTSFVLPGDREALFRAMRARPRGLFISKPPKGSCGYGIKIISLNDFYSIPSQAVVSEYVSKPLCIDGFKCDLRIYVLVTSFSPLRAYVAKEGLARFATESYSVTTESAFSHLTNATLNKRSQHWSSGVFKWKLSELLHTIEQRWNLPREEMMRRIIDVVKMTLALVQPTMAGKERTALTEPYFELYGFDILIDRNFQAHLLEINTMPALSTAEGVDLEVKGPLVAQALSIVGVVDMCLRELVTAESAFALPAGGLAAFDAAIEKQELDRNRLSGDGFLRVFPDPSDPLSEILFTPPVRLTKFGVVAPGRIPNVFLISEVDTIALFCHVLLDMEARIRHSPADQKLVTRLHLFLVAQGYKLMRNTVTVRAILRQFIPRVRQMTTEDALRRMPAESYRNEDVRDIVACIDDSRIKNPRMLFESPEASSAMA